MMFFPNFLGCGPKVVTNADPLPALDTAELESSWENTPVDHNVQGTSSGKFGAGEQRSPPDDSCRKGKASKDKEDEDGVRIVSSVPSPWSPSDRRRSVEAFLHGKKRPNPSSSGDQRAREKQRPWFRRKSIASGESASSVPKEYRHLVDLAALLPQRVVESLVEWRRLGKHVVPRYATKSMEAALLFIDISGFTASMERFAQQGSQGIEKFWEMINAYFCDLLDVIQGTGGDIDCFAGDAILVVYETERLWRLTGDDTRASLKGADGRPVDKLTLATMAAAQCGGRLLNKLSPYHFSDGGTDATLTLHGSVGAGNIQSVNIGGPAGHDDMFFESFVCGSIFEQLAVAHDLSGKSELCLSKQAVALAGRWLDLWAHPEGKGCKILKGVREAENNDPPREAVVADISSKVEKVNETHRASLDALTPAKVVMPTFCLGEPEHTDMFKRLNLSLTEYENLSMDLPHFISRSVLAKIEGARGDGGSEGGFTLGELRRGTVGFVKFEIKDINSASCHEPERGIQAVAEVVMMASREVLISGGFINKVIMDEKGLVLLFAFGTPGCSYEQNNLHAIRVALMILTTSRSKFKREIGVGIATGNICTGLIGKPNFRSEYALAGDVVNLAARLAAAAEKGRKGVLCDENTLKGLIGEDALHEETMAGVGVHSQGSMRPKGKTYDIEVFQVTNATTRKTEVSTRATTLGAATRSNVVHGLSFVHLQSRREPLQKMRDVLGGCNRGALRCALLEADAGLGKTMLVSALCHAPYASSTSGNAKEDAAMMDVDKDKRSIHVVRVQAAHLEQSTPYYVLSAMVRSLITLIVEPDNQGRIDVSEFADAMPAEAQRFLELVRYLRVPLTTSQPSVSVARRRRRSVGTSSETSRRGSQTAMSRENTSGECTTKSEESSYGFQRFADEDNGIGFESVKGLTMETAEFLCQEMRQGVETKDRDYGSTVFKNAFIGSQAVDWLCKKDYAGSRTEAVAIGQRLVEFGLVDHVNSVFRFKDALLYFEFRDSTTPWPRALEMDIDTAKALALRINMEIQATTLADDHREVHRDCFSGTTLVDWLLQERVATCTSEASAIADKLMSFCIVESTDPELERFKFSATSLYHLRALALNSLPPTHIFSVLRQLCLCILQVACISAADMKQLVLIVVEDLHWVDAGTMDMIVAFLQAGLNDPWDGGCMFVITTRPESSFPAHLREKRNQLVSVRGVTTVVTLGALAEGEVVHLTCQLIEVNELDFGLRKLVANSCSGSPLFIAEFCQSLCSTGGLQTVVTSSNKTRAILKTRGKDGASTGVPTTVQEIVAARIDSLDTTVALVLKVAAVIGETFAFDVLETVFPLDIGKEVLKEHLGTLVGSNFLVSLRDTTTGKQIYRFTHSLMSFAAYGMLLHSYRWRLHYHVAMAMIAGGGESNMVLARHWLQVAKGDPSTEEIKDLGGPEAHREMLATTIRVVSQAIRDLLIMGQFIDASLYFKAGLEVLDKMLEPTRRKDLEIDLLLQGCQLTQFTDGYTDNLFAYASKAYTLSCEQGEKVTRETRVRAGLFMAQHEIMYGDVAAAIGKVQELLNEIPRQEAGLRIEPAAILVAVLTQRGQFQQARAYATIIDEWRAAGSPAPLCLVMYEPVVTLMSMSVILAAMGADDSKHLRWINELERYLKESTASKQPFNLYASISLFGALYAMCFEYAEMVRFYHAVYRVVYHPQVLLPVRRGLMLQAPTAVSRVQAKNAIITQGIEVMSLMVSVYDSVNVKGSSTKQNPKYFLKELMSIVMKEPTAATCAAVFQAARILHHWPKARVVLQLWNALGSPSARTSNASASTREAATADDPSQNIDPPKTTGLQASAIGTGGDKISNELVLDNARAARLFCMGIVEVEEIDDEVAMLGQIHPPSVDGDEKQWLERYKVAANWFKEAAEISAKIGNGLMEVRARTAYARMLWTQLEDIPGARRSLRGVFDKFDTLCSQPNFFTPLRLSGLTSAMQLNREMGGCYSSSEDGGEDSDEYGFRETSSDTEDEDDEDDEEEDEEEEGVFQTLPQVENSRYKEARRESRILCKLDSDGVPHEVMPASSTLGTGYVSRRSTEDPLGGMANQHWIASDIPVVPAAANAATPGDISHEATAGAIPMMGRPGQGVDGEDSGFNERIYDGDARRLNTKKRLEGSVALDHEEKRHDDGVENAGSPSQPSHDRSVIIYTFLESSSTKADADSRQAIPVLLVQISQKQESGSISSNPLESAKNAVASGGKSTATSETTPGTVPGNFCELTAAEECRDIESIAGVYSQAYGQSDTSELRRVTIASAGAESDSTVHFTNSESPRRAEGEIEDLQEVQTFEHERRDYGCVRSTDVSVGSNGDESAGTSLRSQGQGKASQTKSINQAETQSDSKHHESSTGDIEVHNEAGLTTHLTAEARVSTEAIRGCPVRKVSDGEEDILEEQRRQHDRGETLQPLSIEGIERAGNEDNALPDQQLEHEKNASTGNSVVDNTPRRHKAVQDLSGQTKEVVEPKAATVDEGQQSALLPGARRVPNKSVIHQGVCDVSLAFVDEIWSSYITAAPRRDTIVSQSSTVTWDMEHESTTDDGRDKSDSSPERNGDVGVSMVVARSSPDEHLDNASVSSEERSLAARGLLYETPRGQETASANCGQSAGHNESRTEIVNQGLVAHTKRDQSEEPPNDHDTRREDCNESSTTNARRREAVTAELRDVPASNDKNGPDRRESMPTRNTADKERTAKDLATHRVKFNTAGSKNARVQVGQGLIIVADDLVADRFLKSANKAGASAAATSGSTSLGVSKRSGNARSFLLKDQLTASRAADVYLMANTSTAGIAASKVNADKINPDSPLLSQAQGRRSDQQRAARPAVMGVNARNRTGTVSTRPTTSSSFHTFLPINGKSMSSRETNQGGIQSPPRRPVGSSSRARRSPRPFNTGAKKSLAEGKSTATALPFDATNAVVRQQTQPPDGREEGGGGDDGAQPAKPLAKNANVWTSDPTTERSRTPRAAALQVSEKVTDVASAPRPRTQLNGAKRSTSLRQRRVLR